MASWHAHNSRPSCLQSSSRWRNRLRRYGLHWSSLRSDRFPVCHICPSGLDYTVEDMHWRVVLIYARGEIHARSMVLAVFVRLSCSQTGLFGRSGPILRRSSPVFLAALPLTPVLSCCLYLCCLPPLVVGLTAFSCIGFDQLGANPTMLEQLLLEMFVPDTTQVNVQSVRINSIIVS